MNRPPSQTRQEAAAAAKRDYLEWLGRTEEDRAEAVAVRASTAATSRDDTQTDSEDEREVAAEVRARAHAEALAAAPDILAELRKEVAQAGFAGPTELVELVFLTVVSRLLARPVCVGIRAASSAGKSYGLDVALRFVAPSAVHRLQAMSSKALYYSNEPLAHRILVIAEGEGLSNEAVAYPVRSLVSEGRLRYEFVDWESRGTHIVDKEGPTGLLLTTTGPIDAELGTRILIAGVDESESQTRAVLQISADEAAGVRSVVPNYAAFQALHELLVESATTVVVPFAPALAELVDARAVRMRRDFKSVLGLVQAHALLHARTRSRDRAARVVATLGDYAAVHRLVGRLVADGVERAVPRSVRQTVQAVRHLAGPRGTPVSTPLLAKALGLDNSSTRRRIMDAVDRGYLADARTGRSRAHQLTLGEPLPEDRRALPTPSELTDACMRARTPSEDGPADGMGDRR